MWRAWILTGAILGGSAHAHDWYTDLVGPDGERCCSGRDCEAVEIREDQRSGELKLLIGKQWLDVEWPKVLPVSSPDGRAHVCWWRSWFANRLTPMVRCIILPSVTFAPPDAATRLGQALMPFYP